MDETTLREVVERAAAGDRDSLAALYGEFHRRVFGLCRYVLGSEMEAEDAASDIFTRLPKALQSYDSSYPFPRWLLSVASNHCVDLLRKRCTEQKVFEPAGDGVFEHAGAEPSPLQELLTTESCDAVRAAVAAMPERYRVPLALRYYNELSYDEIAAALGETRNNVATLIFRAKKELRSALSGAPKETRR
jgi:RNA polymerase sigma-70 factor, ECF subfamily